MIIFQALVDFAGERHRAIVEHERRIAEEDRRREQQQFEALKERYRTRVPDAFTEKAPIDFLQYRLMGFDHMADDELGRQIADIRSGKGTLPEDIRDILALINRAFGPDDAGERR